MERFQNRKILQRMQEKAADEDERGASFFLKESEETDVTEESKDCVQAHFFGVIIEPVVGSLGFLGFLPTDSLFPLAQPLRYTSSYVRRLPPSGFGAAFTQSLFWPALSNSAPA